jgi:DnaJ domain
MDAVARAVASGDDLYALLGVDPGASGDDIRHAYRALARAHHPDANPDDAGADGFRRVVAAYEILGDERERVAYDRMVRIERLAAERRARPGPIASRAAPRPSGAVSSRGRAASPNPADHAPRQTRPDPARVRTSTDEWRLVSVLGRIIAAVLVLVVIAVVALIVVSADAQERQPPPPTIWCRTPDGWYDCWEATSPDGL